MSVPTRTCSVPCVVFWFQKPYSSDCFSYRVASHPLAVLVTLFWMPYHVLMLLSIPPNVLRFKQSCIFHVINVRSHPLEGRVFILLGLTAPADDTFLSCQHKAWLVATQFAPRIVHLLFPLRIVMLTNSRSRILKP